LRESIESILADTPSEVIVVNDGSTDGRTLEVLERLEREGVHVINQENTGTIGALVTGFDAATAPYVLCFAADDVLEPGAISALAEALDANPKAAAAWGDAQTFGLSTFRVPSAPSIDPWLLTYLNPISGMALLRREAIDDVGGWREREGIEDWDLWLSLAERGWRGVRIPRVTFWYRRDGGGRNVENERTLELHYERLRQRHQKLFAERSSFRQLSDAPAAVKLLLPAIERLPVSRLARMHGSELVMHVFWTAGLRHSLRMLRHAMAIRLRR
jgi:cellulose synthase/poly-beta-1,6-N-acetylglucosamine synthase-like glycosyltransferase